MEVVEKKLLFNPNGDDSEKSVIGGNTTNVFDLYNIKYKEFEKLYKRMMENHWIPEKTSMTDDKASYTKMSEDEKTAYLKILSFLIFLDSIQTNNVPNIANYVTAPEIVLTLSRQAFEECVSEDTNVLCESRGWVNISEIEVGDRIFACDENMNGKFTEVEHMSCYDYKGTMYELSNMYVSKKVTPNHRILYIDRNGSPKVCFAKDMIPSLSDGDDKYFTRGDIPNAVRTFESKNDNQELDMFSRFLIALQADGSINKRKNNTNYEMNFSFAKERKIKRLTWILDELGFFYTTTKDKRNGKTIFYVKIPKNSEYSVSKTFRDVFNASKFSQNQAQEFIYELFHWDGWDYNRDGKGYDTTVPDNAYFVTEVAAVAGFRTKIHIHEDKRCERYKDLYRVSINVKKKTSVRGTVKVSKVPYDGKVYCPTVDGSFFLCMRDGKTTITGNSVHSKSYGHIMTSIFDKETAEKAIYYWREDPVLFERNSYIAQIYQDFLDNPTDPKKFIKVLIANYLLEGVYFYNGFAFFYNLASRGLMPNTAIQIRYINRAFN